jgi:F-type H+-transporting ATPase subunit epsilon|tara:strand:- start:2117 stop:2452 length:336 start_codon:yes stop_codon:yes gene_type:complete
MSLNLEIISPQKTIFNEEVDLCIFPGVEGDLGILKNHMPFLTTLRIGIVYIYQNKKLLETFLVNGGVLEIIDNKCTLLAEDIVKSADFKIEETGNEIELKKLKVTKNLYYT